MSLPMGVDLLAVAAVTVVVLAVLMPFLTLIHELGHALVMLVSSRENVLVFIGTDQSWKLDFGRLVFFFSFSDSWRGMCYFEADVEELSTGRRVVFHLAGPVATGLLLAAVLWLRSAVGVAVVETALLAVAGYLGLTVTLTLLPIKYPQFLGQFGGGSETDGYRALAALLGS